MEIFDNNKKGNYWYVSRTTTEGRFYPYKVTLSQGVNTTIWTRKFNNAMVFSSEFAANNFAKSRDWNNDTIEIIHIQHGAMRNMIKIK
jgi:hypothetical protein